jgi:DNA-binding transcriptional LysR family regulator
MQTVRLFFDVARCRSFSQAAKIHCVTQSAASQRIGQLEKRLGVILIDRSVRPLALTEAGQTFLQGCGDLLDMYDRLERQVADMSQQPQSRVRVAAIYSAGIELLDGIGESFQSQWPEIDVQISYEKPDEVYRRVLDGECDVGILSYPQRWRKVGVIPLREEVMAVVCNPRHPLAQRKQIEAGELANYPMVTFDTQLPVGRRIRSYLRDHGVSPRITYSFDNIDTIKNAVVVTDQLSILPVRTVLRDVNSGILATAALHPSLVRPLGVIFRKRRRGNGAFIPAVRTFVDYLLEHAGPSVDLVSPISMVDRGLAGAAR